MPNHDTAPVPVTMVTRPEPKDDAPRVPTIVSLPATVTHPSTDLVPCAYLTPDTCPGCGMSIAVPASAQGESWREMDEHVFASLWCVPCDGAAPFLVRGISQAI